MFEGLETKTCLLFEVLIANRVEEGGRTDRQIDEQEISDFKEQFEACMRSYGKETD